MNLIDALQLPSLRQAKVVAGGAGLHQPIRWVSIVDLPDPVPWIGAGHFLLTTGSNWPQEEDKLRALVTELAEQGVAGVGLAVPQYWDRMPEAACKAADELNLPLLEIPWEIQFHSVTQEVLGAILQDKYKWQEKTEFIHHEMMRIALDAKDLQDIVRSIGKLLGRPAAIQHPDGSLLAGGDVFEKLLQQGGLEKPPSLRATSKPRRLAAGAAGEEGAVGAAGVTGIPWSVREAGLAETARAAGVSGDEEAGVTEAGEAASGISIISGAPKVYGAANVPSRLVCPISIKKELAGLLWVIEDEKVPLSELDLRSVQLASIVIALHISHQRALTSLEAQLGHSFLDSLIEDSFKPTPQMLRRAALHGFDPGEVYSVGLIVVDMPVPLTREGIVHRERLAVKLKKAMEDLGMPAVCSFIQNQIVFLIPQTVQAAQLWSRLQTPDLSMAVSLAHQGLDNVHQGYKEAVSIVPHLDVGRFHLYEDLMMIRVLRGDRDAHSAFTNQLLAPLRSVKNGDKLIQSLLAYAETGFHLKRTADQLHIHPKTLRYRLDQAIALGEYDLQDAEMQFKLQLACRLLRLVDQN